jgi:phenylpropionate dioxygenase-like ring-hydroxylating dioxygenase large terminal subunit
MATTLDSPTMDSPPAQESQDLRELIPELGLREYWYPAIRDREVGWKRPVFVKMLGDDLCLFRGKSGQVVALANACPHRGAMLAKGDCIFKGFVTCFYHGFTFDERGECVAAIGEGPESPMPGQIRAKTYPTVTLKGIVFAWMGQGEPTPLQESIPEEFFDDGAMILNWITAWPANWRPCLEAGPDAHFRYVHRNSLLQLMRPISRPSLPIKGRPAVVAGHRLRPASSIAQSAGTARDKPGPYQDYYPLLGDKWPRHRWRLLWTWQFDWAQKRRYRQMYPLSEEWGGGYHLPSIIRLNYGTHVYTRWVVPVEPNRSRIFYFHAPKPSNALGRVYERLHWTLFHNWAMNKNFSEQDARLAIEAYYEAPQNLSPSDINMLAWRKLLATAAAVPPKGRS